MTFNALLSDQLRDPSVNTAFFVTTLRSENYLKANWTEL